MKLESIVRNRYHFECTMYKILLNLVCKFVLLLRGDYWSHCMQRSFIINVLITVLQLIRLLYRAAYTTISHKDHVPSVRFISRISCAADGLIIVGTIAKCPVTVTVVAIISLTDVR